MTPYLRVRGFLVTMLLGAGRGRHRLGVAAAVLLVCAGLAPSAPARGFGEPPPEDGSDEIGFSELNVTSLTGPSGPIPRGETATYTAVVTNQGNEAGNSAIGLYAFRENSDKPVNNPFRSIAQSGGGPCEIVVNQTGLGDYHSGVCDIPTLEPNQSAEIVATVEINESMDLHADYSAVEDLTTLVDAPPEVTGSSKIKVRGLPQSCVSRDFTLKASAKKAKKMVATLRGPLNALGKPDAGEFAKTSGLETVKGGKLRAPIDADGLELAYYEIKLAAKYDGKPKQKAAVFFQRC